MKMLKRIVIGVGIVFILLLGAGVYLLGSEDVPETTNFVIDLPQLRAEANRVDGVRPTQIRFENIATGGLPRAFSMAGEGFDSVEMPRPVFQILSPSGSYVLIDSAYDRSAHEARFSDQSYFDDAWNRLVVAMDGASQIVVTHEHSDHLGGVASHPRALELAEKLRLNLEQIDTPRTVDVALPAELVERLKPVIYDDMLAIAPGIVLLRSPGHTPGSQMIFVTLADGKEFLFVGDVVWNRDAITELKYRPRFITDLLLDEDRAAVLDQIRALRDLYDEGGVAIVVSHDARTFSGSEFIEGFASPTTNE